MLDLRVCGNNERRLGPNKARQHKKKGYTVIFATPTGSGCPLKLGFSDPELGSGP